MWLDVGRQDVRSERKPPMCYSSQACLPYEHINGHCTWRGLRGSFIRRHCLTGWVAVTRDLYELEAKSSARFFAFAFDWCLWTLTWKQTTRLRAWWSKDVGLAGKVWPLVHVGRQAFSLEEVRLRILPSSVPSNRLSICNSISLPRTFFSVPAPHVGLSLPPDRNLS